MSKPYWKHPDWRRTQQAIREITRGCEIGRAVSDRLARLVSVKPLGVRRVSYNGSEKPCQCWQGKGSRGGVFVFCRFERVRNTPKII